MLLEENASMNEEAALDNSLDKGWAYDYSNPAMP
jgi:hypothetical protein